MKNYRSAVGLREAPRIQEMCYDAASRLYAGANQPSIAYQNRVARLLFMTIAHESGSFRYRRQHRYRFDSDGGAFGLAQCEKPSIMASTKQCDANPALEQRMKCYLFCWPGWSDWLKMRPHLQTRDGDRLSIGLCRLHYLRIPKLVPATAREQAEYAKRYYNSMAGKATPEDYFQAFVQLWPGE